LNKEEDDMLEDVDSLMKMIGEKKKDVPPKPAPEKKPPPAADSTPSSGTGDFSALMKKLGMANKP